MIGVHDFVEFRILSGYRVSRLKRNFVAPGRHLDGFIIIYSLTVQHNEHNIVIVIVIHKTGRT